MKRVHWKFRVNLYAEAIRRLSALIKSGAEGSAQLRHHFRGPRTMMRRRRPEQRVPRLSSDRSRGRVHSSRTLGHGSHPASVPRVAMPRSQRVPICSERAKPTDTWLQQNNGRPDVGQSHRYRSTSPCGAPLTFSLFLRGPFSFLSPSVSLFLSLSLPFPSSLQLSRPSASLLLAPGPPFVHRRPRPFHRSIAHRLTISPSAWSFPSLPPSFFLSRDVFL